MSIQTDPVDRREEVIERREPGYVEREAVVSDVVAQQRSALARVSQLLWLLAGLLEAMLALRFLLRLLGASESAAIATWVYRLTDLFLFPFQGLFNNPTVGPAVFEITTAIAMLVYAVAAWAFVTLLNVLFARSYTTTSSTHRHISTDTH